MALKCFNNLDFSQHETCLLLAAPIASNKMMGIKETHYGVFFECGMTSHLGKKLLLPGLLDSMLYKLEMQDHRKKITKLFQNKVGWSFSFLLHRRNWINL